MTFWEILVIGGLGGFLNCILFDNGFLMPSLLPINKQRIIQLGFIGNILLGAAAGFIVYAFIAQELTSIKQIAIIFLGGIGGGNVLISFLQKYQIQIEKKKTDTLENLIRNL